MQYARSSLLTPESQALLPAVPLQNRGNDHLPNSLSILGRRERSSSPCSPPRNRQRLAEKSATTETASSETGMDSDAQGETTRNRNRSRNRGRGTGTGRNAKDSNCGAAAPPAWTYDPRPALDKDLSEEEFYGSKELPKTNIPYVRPEPEIQVLSSPGYHFVVDLALACRKFLRDAPGEENPIHQIFELVKTSGTLESDTSARLGSVMVVDSLENIAARCRMADVNSKVMDFVFMINAIQLRCKVIRLSFFLYTADLTCSDRFKSSICKAKGWKKTPVLESIKGGKHSRTLARYVSDAAKFCLLAGGGVFLFYFPVFINVLMII